MTFSLNFFPHHSPGLTRYSKEGLLALGETLSALQRRPDVGFHLLPDNQELLASSLAVFKKRPHIKNFIHVGIGGSSLGPKMLIESLSRSGNSVRFEFIDNVDPDRLSQQLVGINKDESLFFIVSKSGKTVETMANFSAIINHLSLTLKDLREKFVFATDPDHSELKDIANQYQIDCLEIPANVGGRYSALSPVGLLPCLYADINIDRLLEGGRKMLSRFELGDLSNPIISTAAFILTQLDQGKDQTVLMPYSSKLKSFSHWFVQLWAESLGKKHDIDGRIVFQGLTPIPAYGVTDQHSQVQLFVEGPNNKVSFFIDVTEFENNFSLKNDLIQSPTLNELGLFSMSDLLKAELFGTLKAFQEAERAYCHLVIESIDELHMGKLILYFEALTAVVGMSKNIDPFNQPGVEAGKLHARAWLKKLGKGS